MPEDLGLQVERTDQRGGPRSLARDQVIECHMLLAYQKVTYKKGSQH